MPMTPNGAAAPYATAADFIVRVDARLLGDLAKDDGTQADPTALLTDPNLAAALADASGEVEGACLAGKRYAVADLQALAGNGASVLKRIVCGLAVQFMRERRNEPGESDYPMYKWAVKRLDDLRSGAAILPFAQTEAAGLPETVAVQPGDFSALTPTILTNNMRYFGSRNNRRGPGGYDIGYGGYGGY